MEKLAISLAGHDKDRVYAVVAEQERDVWLADGKHKTLDAPKKKRRSHVQLVTHFPDAFAGELGKAASDSDLVHVLRLYQTMRSQTATEEPEQ